MEGRPEMNGDGQGLPESLPEMAIASVNGASNGNGSVNGNANGSGSLIGNVRPISIESEMRAKGQWSLFFHNINLAGRTLTQMGVEYDDIYVKQDGRWWIAETRSRRLSCLVHGVDDMGQSTVAVMGDPPAQFGEA